MGGRDRTGAIMSDVPGIPLALRHMLPRPIAYVLGGGGSRGAVQLGMMRALKGTDLRPDLVVGTSVGALNGAILASQPDDAEERLELIWARIDRQQVFPGGAVRQTLSATRSHRPYVFDSEPLSDLLGEYLPVDTIEELEVPFAAVATDLDTGARVELDSGDLRSALLASTAIPIAFPWVERDGRRLVDGGLVCNVPVRQAVDRGARSVIVLDCGIFGPEGKWAEGLVGVAVQAFTIAGRAQLRSDLAVAAEVPVLYLPVPDVIPTTMFDFDSTAGLAHHAYSLARNGLEYLAEWGPTADVLASGLYGHPPLAAIGPELELLRDRLPLAPPFIPVA